MRGSIFNYQQRRGLVKFINGNTKTRLYFLRVLMEIPLVYLHEFAHYLMCLIFLTSPSLNIIYILATKYSKSHKQQVTYGYSASVTYNNIWDYPFSRIVSMLVSFAPIIFILLGSYILVNVIPWYLSTVWCIYLILFRRGWVLSDQDLHTAHVDYLLFINDISVLLAKYKYTIIKTLKGNASKIKRTINANSDTTK